MSLEQPQTKPIVVGYLALQGAAVFGWWALMFFVEASRDWFVPAGEPTAGLSRFWLPDLVLASASWACAWGALRERTWVATATWWLAGVCCYPTMYCLALSVRTDSGWLASGCMAAMSGGCLVVASIQGTASQDAAAYRAVDLGKGGALAWTMLQVVIFWGLFLWVFPKTVVELEGRFGVPAIPSGGWIALAGFGLAGCLGMWSGTTMARIGRGTPLPTAAASTLVTAGPYRWVRNPMAVAGITQGIVMAWWMGSASYIALSLLGGAIWHVFVRPSEEADLEARFGAPYRTYKTQVGLWLPWLFRSR